MRAARDQIENSQGAQLGYRSRRESTHGICWCLTGIVPQACRVATTRNLWRLINEQAVDRFPQQRRQDASRDHPSPSQTFIFVLLSQTARRDVRMTQALQTDLAPTRDAPKLPTV